MPHISYRNREIAFKIVYFGPGWSGKTTNLTFIHRSLAAHRRGEMVMLDTEQERTLFFDFFPLDLGEIEGYSVRLNLYTVPGQLYYEATRRLILDGADGVAFVADSQPARLEASIVGFKLLQENLESYGRDWRRFPLVLQYNKRDLPEVVPVGALERELELDGIPVFEAVAIQGKGVLETIRALAERVVQDFRM